MGKDRTVFFISDGTGITASNMGHSLLTQFPDIEFNKITRPFINTPEKAHELMTEIDEYQQREAQIPLLFTTIVNGDIAKIIHNSNTTVIDFFSHSIKKLEVALETPSSHSIGLTHGMQNLHVYNTRIDAMNFALACDDGTGLQHYKHSDIILVGASRCGKTPTSLYLALQFGIYAANYPFTAEDNSLQQLQLPDSLKTHKKKLFGLSIDPHHLHSIRSQRRANSTYASLRQCQREVETIESLYTKENIPFLDTSSRSIEEISTTIMEEMGLERKNF